jgi:biotin carboxyl carrier protein
VKYTVRLFPKPDPPLVVDLPSLRAGETVTASVDGRPLEVSHLGEVGGEALLSIEGRLFRLRELPPTPEGASSGVEVRFLDSGWMFQARVESEADRLRARARGATSSLRPFTIESPLPGVVRRVLASKGQSVLADTPLFTLEAMKMENEVRAGRPGRVAEVYVKAGQVVNAGDPLARLEPG